MKTRLSLSTRPLLLALAAAASFAAVPAGAAPATETTRVIVAYKPGAAAAIRGAVSAARGSVALEIHGMDAMAVEVPMAALNGLMRNPNVEYVEEDAKRYPFATTSPSGPPYASDQFIPWGIKAVQANQLAGTNASSRMVCIIDSGYSRGHEDLSDGANVTGTNDNGTGNWYTDENHHGTHVAGTISALNNAGTGVVGVSENASLRLHIIKVFSATGWAYSSTLAAAANKCRDVGANIISMSLGGNVSSRTEQTAFDNLLKANILSIAAAGNGGNSRTSYPAGYASVVSVAAVDENLAKASFSQYNKDVEIAGPGVAVLSTVPTGTGLGATLIAGGKAYWATPLDGAPSPSNGSGTLFDFGDGTALNTGAGGKVCLIRRGTNTFAEKVANCQTSGGRAAIIYNNVAGDFSGTLNGAATAIPSASVSDTDGTALKGMAGTSTASLAIGASNYAVFDGTSMATPHVSAVAALVWSFNTSCSATQIRNLLNATALDLGAKGRDTSFGYGLVQAAAARARVATCGL